MPDGTSVRETLVSWLLFHDDVVIKGKKQAKFSFLDLSTVDRREAACQAEVSLNRRLAPDVYLGVGHILLPDGRTEPVVVMRRLPAERSLERLVRSSEPHLEVEIDELARILASFHASVPMADDPAAVAGADTLIELWSSTLDELDRFAGHRLPAGWLDGIRTMAVDYLTGRRLLLEERIARDRIRDGHGDLLPSDVFCLDDGPRVLDCLEFDARLRQGDVVSDVASLAMGLEGLGRIDLAQRLQDDYRRWSGDDWAESLWHHWVAYRAAVRAKVACLRAEQECHPPGPDARMLVGMSYRHLQAGRPRLVLVGGVPGSGKSTLARLLAVEGAWSLLSSDDIRPRGSGPAADRYSEESKDAVYAALLDGAARLLAEGRSVVLDATWSRQRWRARAAETAADARAELYPVLCTAPVALCEDRVRRRQRRSSGSSEATPAVVRRLTAEFAPWRGARRVDTTAPRAEVAASVMTWMRRRDARSLLSGGGGRPARDGGATGPASA